jgi:hypothetical protein
LNINEPTDFTQFSVEALDLKGSKDFLKATVCHLISTANVFYELIRWPIYSQRLNGLY